MYSSETFGRLFWVDDDYEFKSCPLNLDEMRKVSTKIDNLYNNLSSNKEVINHV